jgi:hypothetical protein
MTRTSAANDDAWWLLVGDIVDEVVHDGLCVVKPIWGFVVVICGQCN